MEYESKKRGSDNASLFGLNSWKDQVANNWDGRDSGEQVVGEDLPSSVEMLLDI